MPPGLSSAMTMKRIQRELADLKKEDLGDMVLQPSESNLHIWSGRIPGPQGSLYEGGIFDLEMLLPADYPFSAPKVQFKTRIYHMNISEHGAICIDILKGQWSPALSLFKVLLSLSSLLTDPNPKDPLVPSIAQQYLRSRKQHDEIARQWTKAYAMPKPPVAPPVEKSKGKSRAAPVATPTSTSTATRRSTRSSAMSNEVIVLSDSEGEAAEPKPKKRKRSSDVASRNTGEVLELVDSDDDEEAPKRAKARTTAPTPGHSSSAGSSAVHPTVQDEAIVVLD